MADAEVLRGAVDRLAGRARQAHRLKPELGWIRWSCSWHVDSLLKACASRCSGVHESGSTPTPSAQLAKRTLTNLYNSPPTWLTQAHERLDRAVHDAYGWAYPLADDEILARLLELNLARTAPSDSLL